MVVQRYAVVVDDIEGVRAFDAFGGAIRCGANALVEATLFVGIGFAPHMSERRVFVEVLVFEGFLCCVV